MRKSIVFQQGTPAGYFNEEENGYSFKYLPHYEGTSISLTMPREQQEYFFEKFPSFFDGLLPEGYQLDALLRKFKIDRSDAFGQLLIVGNDMVGSVTVKEITE